MISIEVKIQPDDYRPTIPLIIRGMISFQDEPREVNRFLSEKLNVISGNYFRPKDLLKKLFSCEGDFFRSIGWEPGFDSNDTWFDDKYFDWRKEVDIKERAEILYEAISTELRVQIDELIQRKITYLDWHSTIRVHDSENMEVHIKDPKFPSASICITDEGVFEIAAIKVSNKGLDWLRSTVSDKLKSCYERQASAKVAAFQREVNDLEDKVINAKKEGINETLELVSNLSKDWKIESDDEFPSPFFSYQKKILPDKIIYDGTEYHLIDPQNEFYINSLIVYPTSRKVLSNNANHVNVHMPGDDDDYYVDVCTGSLYDAPLKTLLEELPEMLKTMNCTDGYWSFHSYYSNEEIDSFIGEKIRDLRGYYVDRGG
ncbi:MAG: hypothetical protein PVF58_14025 [Candidatus Methanofastidiosia archaeon]|jgi:hypothetical protein